MSGYLYTQPAIIIMGVTQKSQTIFKIKSKGMKRFTFIAVLLMYSLAGFSAKKEITNVGFTFSPATLTIEVGDNVSFVLETMHNAVEVSHATWDANGTTALPGGFSVPNGGGELLPAQLPAGTHWYVCSTHGPSGMKGIIIVGTPTGITESLGLPDLSVFPNPATELITVKANNSLLGTQYFITDQYGRQMLTGKIDNENMAINISQFHNGIYLIQVAGQNKRSYKVIKN
jgi:plastocyanin